jgi:hypothetical protein
MVKAMHILLKCKIKVFQKFQSYIKIFTHVLHKQLNQNFWSNKEGHTNVVSASPTVLTITDVVHKGVMIIMKSEN